MSCFTYTDLVDQASALNSNHNPYLYHSSHLLLQQQNALSHSVRSSRHRSPLYPLLVYPAAAPITFINTANSQRPLLQGAPSHYQPYLFLSFNSPNTHPHFDTTLFIWQAACLPSTVSHSRGQPCSMISPDCRSFSRQKFRPFLQSLCRFFVQAVQRSRHLNERSVQ